MKTLYMKISKETVAENVIFSGDPWRVEVVRKYLDNPVQIAFAREFNTWTGTYKGLPITVTSTGIGSPSAAIAMEEMFACGMKVALRMGTVMSLKDELLGCFFVPEASIREESTSKTYIDPSFPAVADQELVRTLKHTITNFGYRAETGLNATLDGFYSQMHSSEFSLSRGINVQDTFNRLRRLGVTGLDMESSCIMVLGRLMNVKTAVLTLVTVLEDLKQVMAPEARAKAEDDLCRIALESLWQFSQTGGK